jgi:hypothetical protein
MTTETLDRIFMYIAIVCLISGTVLQCRSSDYTEGAKKEAYEALHLVKAQDKELQKMHDINRRMFKALDAMSKGNQAAIAEIKALDSTYNLSLDSSSLAIQRKRQLIENMFRNIFNNMEYK